MICVDLNLRLPKLAKNTVTSRDYRRIRNNPNFFLKDLAKIKWESLKDMEDVDHMEKFWSLQINDALDILAPWTTRIVKEKRYIRSSANLLRRSQITSDLRYQLMKSKF